MPARFPEIMPEKILPTNDIRPLNIKLKRVPLNIKIKSRTNKLLYLAEIYIRH